jgi:hypothetical protein
MFPGSKARPVRRADNFTAICERIVQTLWDPQHLTNLQAYTVCYGNSFTVSVCGTLPNRHYGLIMKQVADGVGKLV